MDQVSAYSECRLKKVGLRKIKLILEFKLELELELELKLERLEGVSKALVGGACVFCIAT